MATRRKARKAAVKAARPELAESDGTLVRANSDVQVAARMRRVPTLDPNKITGRNDRSRGNANRAAIRREAA